MSSTEDAWVAKEVAEVLESRGDGYYIEYLNVGDGEFKVWLKDHRGNYYHEGYYKVVPA